MYQCPHLTSLRAKTGTEQELSWMLFVCACVFLGASGCMHSQTCVSGCVYTLGSRLCACLFKAVFAFQGCCCSVIKRRGTKGEGREKGVKLLFSKQRRLLVRVTALIRRTVAVDKHDHRGQSVNSNRPVGTFKAC